MKRCRNIPCEKNISTKKFLREIIEGPHPQLSSAIRGRFTHRQLVNGRRACFRTVLVSISLRILMLHRNYLQDCVEARARWRERGACQAWKTCDGRTLKIQEWWINYKIAVSMSGFLVQKEFWCNLEKLNSLFFRIRSWIVNTQVIKATFCRSKLNSSAKTTQGNDRDRKLGGRSNTYMPNNHFAFG